MYRTYTASGHRARWTLALVAIVQIAVSLLLVPVNDVDRGEVGDMLLNLALFTCVVDFVGGFGWLVGAYPASRTLQLLCKCSLLPKSDQMVCDKVRLRLLHVTPDTKVFQAIVCCSWDLPAFARDAKHWCRSIRLGIDTGLYSL